MEQGLRRLIVTRLQRVGFEDAQEIAALAAPSWRLVPRRVAAASLRPGASRFGGPADVPPGFVWPRRDGRPLDLLAQLELSKLRVHGLPRSGWLLFFYDGEDQPWGGAAEDIGGSVTLHVAGPARALVRMSRPRDDGRRAAPCCALRVRRTVDLPHAWDSVFQELGYYYELEDPMGHEVVRALARVASSVSRVKLDEAYHHVLGHPRLRQPDLRGDCALIVKGFWPDDADEWSAAKLRKADKLMARAHEDWRLLLQLDTDEVPGWMWGDAGTLYAMIHRDDLAARRFDRVLTFLQSG